MQEAEAKARRAAESSARADAALAGVQGREAAAIATERGLEQQLQQLRALEKGLAEREHEGKARQKQAADAAAAASAGDAARGRAAAAPLGLGGRTWGATLLHGVQGLDLGAGRPSP